VGSVEVRSISPLLEPVSGYPPRSRPAPARLP
jgi:hypothetical protein